MKAEQHAVPYSSIVHSIIASSQIEQIIAANFGLQAAETAQLLQHGLNDHYLLHTADDDLIVRVYRHGWRSNNDVTWELGLLEHLSTCGAPVATPLRCIDGRLFAEMHAPEGIRQVAVFQRAPGQYTHFGSPSRYRVSPADCAEQFGRSVAEVHACADSYVPTATRLQLDLDHLLHQPLRAISAVFGYRADELTQMYGIAEQMRQILGGEQASLLDWGPCHGDMSGGNSTFWQNRVFHFDFDCGGPGYRAYDLGVFLWSLTINGHGQDVWQPFLQGYRSRRSLSHHDEQIVPVFAALRVIWLMGLWCQNTHVFGRHTLHNDYFDREVNRLCSFSELAQRPYARHEDY